MPRWVKRKRQLSFGLRVCDVPNMSPVASVTVKVLPDLTSFKIGLRAEVIAASVEADWIALRKKLTVLTNAENAALCKALARAEWLATSDRNLPSL